jgi:hypothetical protein
VRPGTAGPRHYFTQIFPETEVSKSVMQELSNVPWQIVVSGTQTDDTTIGSGLGFKYKYSGHWYRTEMSAGTGVDRFCLC